MSRPLTDEEIHALAAAPGVEETEQIMAADLTSQIHDRASRSPIRDRTGGAT